MSAAYPDKNKVRASRAQRALDFYKNFCLGEGAIRATQDDLTDLLSDVRHLCAQNPDAFNFADAARLSEDNFNAELMESED